jgi:hypothetical protein
MRNDMIVRGSANPMANDGIRLHHPISMATKSRTVKDVTTQIAGKQDAEVVMKLLTKYPFPDIDCVQYTAKRAHACEWIKRLHISNIQANQSLAIEALYIYIYDEATTVALLSSILYSVYLLREVSPSLLLVANWCPCK